MKAEYARFFFMIETEFGDMPVQAVEELGSRAVFETWRNSMTDTPRQADKAWSALKRVFSFAVASERLKRNPCVGGKHLWKGSRAEIIWSDAEIALFKARTGYPCSSPDARIVDRAAARRPVAAAMV